MLHLPLFQNITTEMGVSIQQWRAAIGKGAGKSRKKRKQQKGSVHETLTEKAVHQEANQVQMYYMHKIIVLNTIQLYNVLTRVQNFTNTCINVAGAKVDIIQHIQHCLMVLPLHCNGSAMHCGSPASSGYYCALS